MKLYSWLLLLLFVSCKKNDEDTRVAIRQQPSRIQVLNVNPVSLSETVQHTITFTFNDSTKRFDSIRVDGFLYTFDYSKLSSENKILLNYSYPITPYQELLLDGTNYTLLYYKERQDASTVLNSFKLQYDSINRIRSINTTLLNAEDNFRQIYTPGKFDTVFVTTIDDLDVCISRDTIAAGLKELNTTLPYLMLLDINPVCNIPYFNILRALPFSNYTYKLPTRLINGNTEAIYTYRGDTKQRMAEALITVRDRSANSITSVRKIVLSY